MLLGIAKTIELLDQGERMLMVPSRSDVQSRLDNLTGSRHVKSDDKRREKRQSKGKIVLNKSCDRIDVKC